MRRRADEAYRAVRTFFPHRQPFLRRMEMLRESKHRPANVAKLVFSSTLLIAGSAFMWGMGTPLPVTVIWLVIIGASLAIDPLGEWRFLTGIAVATVVVGLW